MIIIIFLFLFKQNSWVNVHIIFFFKKSQCTFTNQSDAIQGCHPPLCFDRLRRTPPLPSSSSLVLLHRKSLSRASSTETSQFAPQFQSTMTFTSVVDRLREPKLVLYPATKCRARSSSHNQMSSRVFDASKPHQQPESHPFVNQVARAFIPCELHASCHPISSRFLLHRVVQPFVQPLSHFPSASRQSMFQSFFHLLFCKL